MGAQHTPGPWSWTQDDAGQWFLSPGVLISDGTDGTPDGDEIDLANATLIAAAPELLEALETHPGYSGDVSFGEIWKWLAKREAAIAKARGAA